MKTKLLIRVTNVTQRHVTVSIFMGPSDGTLANCGTLTFLHPEYQLFATAPLIARDTMQHHLEVAVEEDLWIDYHKAVSSDQTDASS